MNLNPQQQAGSNHARMLTRRHFLSRCNSGLGALALAQLGGASLLAREDDPSVIDNPLASRPPMIPARAKNVIYLHMAGSPPQLELFDYKPELIKHHGKPMPGADKLITFQGEQGNVTQSPWKFQPRGECGKGAQRHPQGHPTTGRTTCLLPRTQAARMHTLDPHARSDVRFARKHAPTRT